MYDNDRGSTAAFDQLINGGGGGGGGGAQVIA